MLPRRPRIRDVASGMGLRQVMPREASARGGGDAPPPTLMKKLSRRLSKTFGFKSRNQESFYSAWSGDRWNKGRNWNGLDDWCDPQTASEAVEWLEENFNLNDSLLKYTDAMAARFPDKRAITYVDGKVSDARDLK